MAEEMNAENNDIKNLEKGEVIKGKVSKVEEKQALVDVGYKFDGVLPIGEISNFHIEKVSDVLNTSDEVEVKVLKINDEEEKLILSKKSVDSEKAWNVLQERLESQEVFEVTVVDVVKGGLVVDVGLRGFIPASLVEKHFVEDFTDYKGKTLRVMVVELDKEKNKVILSSKAVIEEEEEAKKRKILENIKVGDKIEGTVMRLTDFGAFVDIGGIDGLVHVSEIDWNRIDQPSDVLKEGDKVQVKVLKVDPDTKRISLSIKATKPSPWLKAMEELKVGEIYTGTVKRLANFGAFVELKPNVEGLVHISQISHEHVGNPNEVLEPGQEVKVKVLDIDKESERISLSIREADEKITDGEKYKYTDDGMNLTLGDVLGDKLKKLK